MHLRHPRPRSTPCQCALIAIAQGHGTKIKPMAQLGNYQLPLTSFCHRDRLFRLLADRWRCRSVTPCSCSRSVMDPKWPICTADQQRTEPGLWVLITDLQVTDLNRPCTDRPFGVHGRSMGKCRSGLGSRSDLSDLRVNESDQI